MKRIIKNIAPAAREGTEGAETVSPGRAQAILVPVDFMDGTRLAVDYAARMARESGATIYLLHVLEKSSVAVIFEKAMEAQRHSATEVSPEAALEALADFARNSGAEVRVGLRHGPVAREVCAAAVEWNADLIVLRTRGLQGWRRLSSRGTAEEIIRSAPCPVLSIRRRLLQKRAENPPHGEGARPQILVPVDFSESAHRGLRVATRLALQTKADIVLLHALETPVFALRVQPFPGRRAATDEIREIERRLLDWASPWLDRRITVKLMIRRGPNPAETVEQVTRALNPELIVMGTENESWVKRLVPGRNNLTGKLIRNVRAPVLCLKSPEAARGDSRSPAAARESRPVWPALAQTLPAIL